MSITEITAIDENFPIAGIDQPSQGYRDNFANIKVALTDLDAQIINVIGDISDIDTTTIAPITNDMLSFDGVKWVPQAFEILNDLTPQLGGHLDVNSFSLGDGTNKILDFIEAVTPVNWIAMSNSSTGVSPMIESLGSDVNVGLILKTKNDGSIIIDSDLIDPSITTVNNKNLSVIGSGTGAVTVTSGNNASGTSGDLRLRGGNSTGSNGNGGSIVVRPGTGNGVGNDGSIKLRDKDNKNIATFLSSSAVGIHENYLVFYNDITGQPPGITVFGTTDTNIGLDFTPIGSGKVRLSNISYPNTDGAISGDVMKTDAAGTLSFSAPTDLGEFTIALLPDPTLNANSYALATDAIGGRTIVRSDGTAWKIVVVEGATVV